MKQFNLSPLFFLLLIVTFSSCGEDEPVVDPQESTTTSAKIEFEGESMEFEGEGSVIEADTIYQFFDGNILHQLELETTRLGVEWFSQDSTSREQLIVMLINYEGVNKYSDWITLDEDQSVKGDVFGVTYIKIENEIIKIFYIPIFPDEDDFAEVNITLDTNNSIEGNFSVNAEIAAGRKSISGSFIIKK